eukprot:427973_1
MTRMAMDMPFVIMARSYSIQINLTQTQMALLIDDIKCPFVHNVDQRDSDGDSRGDVCGCPRCPFDLLLTTVHNVAILPCPDDDDDEPLTTDIYTTESSDDDYDSKMGMGGRGRKWRERRKKKRRDRQARARGGRGGSGVVGVAAGARGDR